MSMTRPPQAHTDEGKTPLRQDSQGAKDSPKFGGKVRALRRREGLSQVQLADKIGISPSYLNLIENNRRPLPANSDAAWSPERRTSGTDRPR